MIRLIIITDFSEGFAHNLMSGIMRYSKESELWVVCRMPVSFKEQYGIEGVLQWAKQWEANAIIGQFKNDENVDLFRKNNIVAIAQDYHSRFSTIPNISSDYILTGKMAADFFIRKGFKNFAFYGYVNACWSEERCEGFYNRISEAGYANNFHQLNTQTLESLWYYKSAPLIEWIKSLPYPIALFACDDYQANKIIEVCRIIGVRIPQDIAILGVDNDELLCTLSNPTLSSVGVNIEKGGYEVAKLIEQLVINLDYPYEDIVIQPICIYDRGSTNIYAVKDINVQHALNYIQENYKEKISISDIVKRVPLSRRLLEIKFKEATGCSMYQFIHNLKMEEFAKLLLENNEPIAYVASMVGISDFKNLSRQFKEWKGCSPNQFRKYNK